MSAPSPGRRARHGLAALLAAASIQAMPAATGTLLAASPTPSIDCGRSLQGLVDAAPAGSTLTVPPCTYRESVTIDKALHVVGAGATIDGRAADGRVVRDSWLVITAPDVTVDGFAMHYANNEPQTGALQVATGVSHVTINGCDLGFAAGANVDFGEADDVTLSGCDIHDAGQLGVHLGGDGVHGQRNAVVGNRIHGNNTAGYDPGWEAGGLKATRQVGLELRDNEVFDNHGPGLWCDIYCRDVTIAGNRVHDNDLAGIFFEVSTGARITGNAAWGNGWGKPDWAWGAGILLSSAGGAEVDHNTVAWNATGIGVVSQDRTDWEHHATGNAVHDNVVVGLPGRYLLAWVQDWSGELFRPESANHGSGDRFWVSEPEPNGLRFAWDGDRPTLAEFLATPGGTAASYLDEGAKDDLLTAAGVPTSPAGSDRPAPGTSLVERGIARYWPLGLVAAATVFAVALAAFGLWRWRARQRARAASGDTR